MAQTKPRTPRQQQQYERVLECTRQMLAEAGYEGMQMRVLAERAGVSLMTIYNRFGNKDDLILLALQELLGNLATQAQQSGKQGIEFVLHNAAVIGRQIMATPEYAKAMALMLFNAHSDSPIVAALLTNGIDNARQQIAEMIGMGELDDSIDAELLAQSMAMCGWSSILLWMKGVVTDAQFQAHYARAPLLVLAPAMTAAARARYAERLNSGAA